MPALPVILDVAIGLTFVFIILSSICSSVNEFIARLTNRRGSYLGQGIKYLLWDTKNQPLLENTADLEKTAESASNLVEYIFRSPLVRRLGSDFPKFPAYIPNSSFSLSLINGIRAGTPEFKRVQFLAEELATVAGSNASQEVKNLLQPVAAAYTQAKQDPKLGKLLDPAQLAQLTAAEIQQLEQDAAVQDGLNAIKQAINDARLSILALSNEQIRTGVNALFSALDVKELKHDIDQLPDGYVNPKIKKTLLTLINDAETDIQKLDDVKDRFEKWFDNGMGRVSVLYKRWTQFILVLIALGLVLVVNADAFRITTSLWNDPTLRAALVAQAQSAAAQQSATPAPGTPTPTPANAGTDFQQTSQQIKSQLDQLNGIPIGWSCGQFNQLFRASVTPQPIQAGQTVARSFPVCDQIKGTAGGSATLSELEGFGPDWAGIGLKVVGLALMGFGAALGAPFWFDVLDRLITLRPDKPTSS
jgi:hypothetical protein